MFIREKRNKSGLISVQVINKANGLYKMVKTIGSSRNPEIISILVIEGKAWINQQEGGLELDFDKERATANQLLANIKQISVCGTDLLLGKLFDEIGFNKIPDDLFRKLVIARLCFPASKLRTTDYLSKYQNVEIDVQSVYRYLDKLYQTQKETVQQISYQHTLQVLNHEISMVFYDVTTLYFEIDHEDDLRKAGFSKEGKHQHPQIVLGLLVSIDGYPLAYEIFEGNKFEGHTMLPILESFKIKFKLDKLVIVADSGLLSNSNIQTLQEKGYEYIIGARIKNEKQDIKQEILRLTLKNGESRVLTKKDQTRLIVHYSEARARKDKSNRQRGLSKLEKQIKSGILTKANINNRGYNKYLNLEGEIKVSINEEKYIQDSSWDGLKGYLTNTKLTTDEVIDTYKHL